MTIFICGLILCIILCGWKFILIMTLAIPFVLAFASYISSLVNDEKNWEEMIIHCGEFAIQNYFREHDYDKMVNKKFFYCNPSDHFPLEFIDVDFSYKTKDILGFTVRHHTSGYLFFLRNTEKYGLGWYAPYDDEPTFAYDKKWNCYKYKDFEVVDAFKIYSSEGKKEYGEY